MDWIATTATWYIYLLALGLIVQPMVASFFGKYFLDRGYALGKTVATLTLTYLVFIAGIFKILPFTQSTLVIVAVIIATFNGYLLWRQKMGQKVKKETNKLSLHLVLFEELLFVSSLYLWVVVRGQEPSIRGLEKFMDFGFINSILRAQYFPPPDMWLAGHSINYYYFGHLWGAVLTKFSGIASAMTYNLILATIFALGVTQVFSLSFEFARRAFPNKLIKAGIIGLLGSFIVNLGGNLHAIYAFTTGYPNENPVGFWKLPAKFTFSQLMHIKTVLARLGENYWYPNATRFIPLTIHEFPIYSYVVADLHGHVFDIPFVLLTLAILYVMFLQFSRERQVDKSSNSKSKNLIFKPISTKLAEAGLIQSFNSKITNSTNFNQFQLISTIFLGFLTSVHYMTNAFDGPIYLILSLVVLWYFYHFQKVFFIYAAVLVGSFIVFNFPFSANFSPFVGGIGVNCAPSFLVNIGHLGPFLFEKGNCQATPLWMLTILWGFFWFNFLFFILKFRSEKTEHDNLSMFIFLLFALGTLFTIIPEFFYIKDIYPAHFRANTMFKLGYQAFIMMGLASVFVFVNMKAVKQHTKLTLTYFAFFILFFFLTAIYPIFAIRSYYGDLSRPVTLDGTGWITSTYSEYGEIINFFNTKVLGQPVILEAQGDSYTDYNVVSAYTGLPTVAGWWVHEWLWRGSSDVVGKLAPEVQKFYEIEDPVSMTDFINKYHIGYVVVGSNERKKYPLTKESHFAAIGKLVFQSSTGEGKVYDVTAVQLKQ